MKNYIKNLGPKRIDSIDFEQIYRRFRKRKLFPNVPSHPTTSVDTLFNSMVLDFLSQQFYSQTTTAVSNNGAVLSRCLSVLFFPPFYVSIFDRSNGG